MKCPLCETVHPASAPCHVNGNTKSNQISLKEKAIWLVKIWLVAGLVGLGTGLVFILVHDELTSDLVFEWWEFCITLLTPIPIALFLAIATKSGIRIMVAVACLTLLMPLLGESIGPTDSKPLWRFLAMGLGGGLFWITPYLLIKSFRN